MKRIWNILINGYIPLRCEDQRTGKISIKWLILLIAVIIATNII